MKRSHLNLREKINNNCKKCSGEQRDANLLDGICKILTSAEDNLPVRCVGLWQRKKIYWLTQYFGIFASGMKNKWAGLNYIEICSGPGRCIIKETGVEIDGTSLAVLNHPAFQFLKNAVYIDLNENIVKILNTRIKARNKENITFAYKGNYTKQEDIVNALQVLNKDYLNLVFIDPTDCSVPFETIKTIKNILKNVDILITVAMGMDVTRNIKKAIANPNSPSYLKYSAFLGDSNYLSGQDIKQLAKDGKDKELRLQFAAKYKEMLSGLGYKYTETVQVQHYYQLLFASNSKTGHNFWKKVSNIEPNGQGLLELNEPGAEYDANVN